MKGLIAVVVAAFFAVAGAAYAQEKAAPKKSGTMAVSGTVKSVSGSSLVVTDKSGKEWTFVIDSDTKTVAKGASHTAAEKKAAGEKMVITDTVKDGAKVRVQYHDMGGSMHASMVRVM